MWISIRVMCLAATYASEDEDDGMGKINHHQVRQEEANIGRALRDCKYLITKPIVEECKGICRWYVNIYKGIFVVEVLLSKRAIFRTVVAFVALRVLLRQLRLHTTQTATAVELRLELSA